jgi:uncharacterized RDD family membrane protein YckC
MVTTAPEIPCSSCNRMIRADTSYCPGCGKAINAVEYAGFWIRFLAVFIDGLILIIPNIVISAIAAGDIGAVFVLQFLLNAAYVVGFWTANGATPGKMLMGLQITRRDGGEISAGTAIARYLGYFLSSITLGIGYLMIAFSREKRGLHDRVADTIVIRTR